MKKVLVLLLVVFCVFCGLLVAESGLFSRGQADGRGGLVLLQRSADDGDDAVGSTDEPVDDEPAKLEAVADTELLSASGGEFTRTYLGSVDPNSGYKFELELNSRGAAIETATFSEFDDRDHKDPQPLGFLNRVGEGSNSAMSMANRELLLIDRNLEFQFQKLNWKYLGTENNDDASQTASFEAMVNNGAGETIIRLVKSYTVTWESYLLQCSVKVENMGADTERLRFNMAGPLGLGREAVRMDGRKTVAGFEVDGEVMSVRRDMKKLRKGDLKERRLDTTADGARFLWAASTNKYFAAIVIPRAAEGKEYADWLLDRVGRLYNPDGDEKYNTGDETIGVDFRLMDLSLAGAGESGSSRTYDFDIYLGPKDKELFDGNDYYDGLGFVQTIDFLACCCPGWMIKPLAFGILWLMNKMFIVLQNYGIVIIIFVVFMRLLLHPITKRSQIQMSKFSKLAPKAEEIKKKYANNKAEMQKKMMELYREGGSAPILGMLPMFVQMPIWVALYSAIYASIDLRGAEFLPFWITDLSVPDALIRFENIIKIPIMGWKIESFNLLPMMMGLAFFLQQKLMPSQAAQASSNPQAAQQQKMMMIMMPIMFPLMLYKAPAGLNLYIMSSTFVGAAEQYFIRKHIREREEQESKGRVSVTSKTGGKLKKKKPKPFFKN